MKNGNLIDYVDQVFGPGTGEKAEKLSHDVAKLVVEASKDGVPESLGWHSVILALGCRLSIMSDRKKGLESTCALLEKYSGEGAEELAKVRAMTSLHGDKLHVVN